MRRGELMNRLGQKKSSHMYWPVMIMTYGRTVALGGCFLVEPFQVHVQEPADRPELPGYIPGDGVDVVRPEPGQEHIRGGVHAG